jgi:hypothetical protein
MWTCAISILVLHISCGLIAAGILCANLRNDDPVDNYLIDLEYSLRMGLSGGVFALLFFYDLTDSAFYGCSFRRGKN